MGDARVEGRRGRSVGSSVGRSVDAEGRRARARSGKGQRDDNRARTETPFIRASRGVDERVRERERLTRRSFVSRAQIAAFVWSAVSIRKTEMAHAAELKRLRETKTLAELMSLNMGA